MAAEVDSGITTSPSRAETLLRPGEMPLSGRLVPGGSFCAQEKQNPSMHTARPVEQYCLPRSPMDFFFALFIRSGLVQSPMKREEETGLPGTAAASTRSGRVVPGQVPVHAMRVSAAASEVQLTCAGCNFEGSRPRR